MHTKLVLSGWDWLQPKLDIFKSEMLSQLILYLSPIEVLYIKTIVSMSRS